MNIKCITLLPRDKVDALVRSEKVTGVVTVEGLHPKLLEVVGEYMSEAVGSNSAPVTCVINEIQEDIESTLLGLDMRANVIVLEITVDENLVVSCDLTVLLDISNLLYRGRSIESVYDQIWECLEAGKPDMAVDTISFVPYISSNVLTHVLLLDNSYGTRPLNIAGVRVSYANKLSGIIAPNREDAEYERS